MTTYRFGADLFGELDRLQRQVAGVFAARGGRLDAFPPINLGATDDAIEIVALAPGMQAADFDVTIDKGLLTISGERRIGQAEAAPRAEAATPDAPAPRPAADTPAPARTLARERFSGRFRRAVELPANADASNIEARYEDGCLHIRIAKRAVAQPRTINVQ